MTDRENKAKNYVKEFTENLRGIHLTHQNYKKTLEKAKNYIESIDFSIENDVAAYNTAINKHDNFMADKEVKDYIKTDNVVPKEIYDVFVTAFSHFMSAYDWGLIKIELSNLIVQKLDEALGEVRGLDIQRDVLKQFSVVQQEYIDMLKKSVIEEARFLRQENTKFREEMHMKFEYMERKLQDNMNVKLQLMMQQPLQKASIQPRMEQPQPVQPRMEQPQPIQPVQQPQIPPKPIKQPQMEPNIEEPEIEEVNPLSKPPVKPLTPVQPRASNGKFKKKIDRPLTLEDDTDISYDAKGKRLYKCSICQAPIKDEQTLKAHMYIFHRDGD